MGIERFFSSLNRDFNIIENLKAPYKRIKCTYFMIDFNSIVHITSAHIINKINNKNKDYDPNNFENELLKLIEIYTLDLLKNNIDSNILEYLLICIDGVPTMAKIYEQKKRRYMGNLLSYLTQKLDYSFSWSKNNISPGTNFMKKLENMLNSNEFRNKIKKVCINLQGYLLSDTKNPGEGEMKILNCIRNISRNDNICVYSPDSDMIILLMLVDKPITLLRYDQQKSTLVDKTYNLLNINNFKNILINYCKKKINIDFDAKFLINDIIFIFTIFGDDFLPKLETFRVDKDLFIILDYYLINLIENGHILKFNKVWEINVKIFEQYLRQLQKNEEAFLYRNYNINKYSNYFRIDKDLFSHELFNIKIKLEKLNNIKNFKQIKSALIGNFKNKEFYLNCLKYLDSDSLRNLIIKNKISNKNIKKYYNLFHHYESIEDLLYFISLYYYQTNKLPFTIVIKKNDNLKLLPIKYSSDEKPHVFKIKNLEYNEKLMYKIDNKLDKYFNLFNPKDYFYHKYFSLYNSKLNEITINNYYKIYFNDYNIEYILREYFKGLNWVINYYFNNITNNLWYYPFGKSPLLYNITNQYVNFSNFLVKTSIDNFLITPLEQLLFISPIDINKDILSQLTLLNNILTINELNRIKNFILDNKKMYFNLTKIFLNVFKTRAKILDCSNSIFINKCHLLILEGYIDIKNFARIFRQYIPLEYQRKYYPNIDKLICVN